MGVDEAYTTQQIAANERAERETTVMTPLDWVAIVGAAAWLPQIGTWLYRVIVRPEIRLIPGGIHEVGYTSYGPIFNLTCSLSASRKDAVIGKMTAEVRHEHGESRLLRWAILNETVSQMRSASGERTEISKNQPAIAIKVNTSLLTQTTIGFQDDAFLERRRVVTNALIATMNHYQSVDPTNASADTLKSREYTDYLEAFRHNQFWKPGRYTATIAIHLVDSTKPTLRTLSFELTPDDADRLGDNVQVISRSVTEIAQGLPADQRTPENWNWINPRISTADATATAGVGRPGPGS